MSLVAGLCVFGILTFFKPFDLHIFSFLELVKLTTIYGFATLIVTAVVTVLLPKILPSIFNDSHWTVLHEIIAYILLLTLVALANTAINTFVYRTNFSLFDFLSMLGMVLGVGVLPVCLGVVVKQKQLFKKFEMAATETQKLLSTHSATRVPATPTPPTTIKLSGTNRNEVLEIQPEELLLITSSDNYVEIYFLNRETAQKVIFRNTLKTMQTALSSYPQFYRCHKTNLVNVKKVRHISGNAQGLKLEVEGIKNLVPVSRNLTTAIKEKLKILAVTPQNAGH